jgi:hypothetical protein
MAELPDGDRRIGTLMSAPKVPQRTTPGFAFSIMNRALLECIAVRKFGAPEIAELLSFFGNDPPVCAFCGAEPIMRWDHLVSVTQGGDTVLGNMVPACSKCDDSKGHQPFDVWALGPAPGSPQSRGISDVGQRLEKIRQYVARYGYQPRTPDQRLNAEELRQFEVLRADLSRVRKDFDELIADFRKRSGLR